MNLPPMLADRIILSRLQHKIYRNLTKNQNLSLRTHLQKRPNSTNSTKPSSQPKTPDQRTIPSAWGWIDPLLTPLRGYARMQTRSPLITQFESTLVIWYLGDLSAQSMSTNVFVDGEYEPLRALRSMLIGGLIAVPGYKWFLFLGRHFNYSSKLLSLAVKITVNQIVYTPLFNVYFFAMQTFLSGGGWKEAKERVVSAVPISVWNSLKLWPAVTAINFAFVPWQHRNVFAGFVAIGWQTYLSWLNRFEENREVEGRKGVDEEVGETEERKSVSKKRKKGKKKDEEVDAQRDT